MFQRGHFNENVCATLANFHFFVALWISLCVNRYKAGFCWGMQQSVIFLQFFYCRRSRTPYNAPPSTRRM
ncbi:hypothetical protein AO703_01175 [[Enterobacter] lignolyticus]|uniref:Uncharacterized protein n=1 Tax=[Enterobacter] lignolyticus TaxID=1334193 RepID=A0A806X858_9ENTR|nr:hypothetical protein AO703_01175 [[Enterobacter] lignolyticus]